jgi:hypothetical protein
MQTKYKAIGWALIGIAVALGLLMAQRQTEITNAVRYYGYENSTSQGLRNMAERVEGFAFFLGLSGIGVLVYESLRPGRRRREKAPSPMNGRALSTDARLSTSATEPQVLEEVAKAHELLKSGALTEAEYERFKQGLIKRPDEPRTVGSAAKPVLSPPSFEPGSEASGTERTSLRERESESIDPATVRYAMVLVLFIVVLVYWLFGGR